MSEPPAPYGQPGSVPSKASPSAQKAGRPPKARVISIVALDPGQTTGVALTHYDTSADKCTYIRTHELIGDHYVDLYRLLCNEQPQVVVYEYFVYQNRKEKVELESREYIGVAKLYAHMTDKSIVGQTASAAKQLWTADKLTKIGLWEPNRPHAMDAVRHLLLFLVEKIGSERYIRESR